MKNTFIPSNEKHWLTQPQLLKDMRNGRTFDFLEKILHQSALLLLKNNLENKISELKTRDKSKDFSEQEKMIEVLGDSIEWVAELHRTLEVTHISYVNVKKGMNDMKWLNDVLTQRNEELEKKIKTMELQQNF